LARVTPKGFFFAWRAQPLPSFDGGLKLADEGIDFLQVFAASPFGIDLEEGDAFEDVVQAL
jgi:hypothetical protein